MKPRLFYVLMLSAALGLSACETVALTVGGPMLTAPKEVNLMNANYAAAETLATNTQRHFRRENPISVANLYEILDMKQNKVIANPRLGRVMSEQIRSRFAQLGYNVIDPDIQTGKPAAEVTGNYRIVKKVMTVNLRMVDTRSGQQLAMYEYSLPVTYDIRKHMENNANLLPSLDRRAFEDFWN